MWDWARLFRFAVVGTCMHKMFLTKTQGVSHLPVTAETRLRSQPSLCEICGERSSASTGFLLNTYSFLVLYHFSSFIIFCFFVLFAFLLFLYFPFFFVLSIFPLIVYSVLRFISSFLYFYFVFSFLLAALQLSAFPYAGGQPDRSTSALSLSSTCL